MGLLMRKYFSACIFLLQYRPQRPRIVARLRIDAEVPARLVDLRGGEDFHQRVLAGGKRLLRRDLEPVLTGEHLDLGGNGVFVLGDLACEADRKSTRLNSSH